MHKWKNTSRQCNNKVWVWLKTVHFIMTSVQCDWSHICNKCWLLLEVWGTKTWRAKVLNRPLYHWGHKWHSCHMAHYRKEGKEQNIGAWGVAAGRMVGGGRGEITRGSVYRPFYFPIILGSGNENIHRHRQQKGQKRAITACQEHNKVKFINIHTCTQPTITTTHTQVNTHTGIAYVTKHLILKWPFIYHLFIFIHLQKCSASRRRTSSKSM